MSKKLNLVILRNEDPMDYKRWETACIKFQDEINYRIVDLTRNDWLEKITTHQVDYLLTKPGGKTSQFRKLYEERLEVLVNDLGYQAYPNLQEVKIYESKRYISYWLKANKINAPQTDVFYHENEAVEFVRNTSFPIVGKMNIGASGNGVKILRDFNHAQDYIKQAFSSGISSRTGPKLSKGKILERVLKKIKRPGELKARLRSYKEVAADIQKGFVILQQFIPHDFEWRVVRIGNSFFAHKKLKKSEMASGSLLKGYDNPPLNLFDFVKSLTDRFGFTSQAVDIFETKGGEYLVNEMQCIFGQSDPYQMLVNGKMGRYIFKNNEWLFEEGDYNTNESFDLRVRTVIDFVRSAK